jgi:RND family efflux transporter MFP subunit
LKDLFRTFVTPKKLPGALISLHALPFFFLRMASSILAMAWSVTGYAQVPSAPPVIVAVPLRQDITEWLEYTGQFAAMDYVEVRARVSGFLTELHFKDGQIVSKGDLLFVIDPRPYEIELQLAEAQRDTAAAQLEYATRDVSRGATLRQSDTLAANVYEQRIQQMKTSAAALQTANARIRQAQLDLEFSHVTSPITGRIGNHLASIGNLVIGGASGGSSTLLTSIVSLDPVWFYFDMSESDFLLYQRTINEGRIGSAPRRVEISEAITPNQSIRAPASRNLRSSCSPTESSSTVKAGGSPTRRRALPIRCTRTSHGKSISRPKASPTSSSTGKSKTCRTIE